MALFHRASFACGIAAAGIGVLGILGWTLDIPWFRSVYGSTSPIRFGTALALALLGGSLSLGAVPSERFARAAELFAAVAALFGFLNLFRNLTGIDLAIDDFVFRRLVGSIGPPARMALHTALSFVLLGLAGVLLNRKRWTPAVESMCLVILVLSAVQLVGYLYQLNALFAAPDRHKMSIHTAMAFLLVAAGTFLARPERGLASIAAAGDVGGLVVRKLLPVILLAPMGIGWVRLTAERLGLIDTAQGVALMALTSTGLLTALVLRSAARIRRIEVARHDAEAALKKSEVRYQRLTELSPAGTFAAGDNGLYTYVSARWCEICGMDASAALGDGWVNSVHAEDRERVLSAWKESTTSGSPFKIQFRIQRLDGEVLWILSQALKDETGAWTGTCTDVSEQTRLNLSLQSAVADLKAANEELSAFTYVASHDLQEPVRNLVAFSALLREDLGYNLPEDAETDLHFITESANRMHHLVSDLLLLSRAGRSAPNQELVSANDCVREALENLHVRIRETNARITAAELPSVYSDPLQLVQLYQNLIGNALKFTQGEPPKVELTAEQADGAWILGVRDHGIGIDPVYAEKIFQPFQRLHGRTEYEGTGIGLAICKRNVERHGGRIWVESQPGQGAHFRFTLPAGKGD